MYEQDEMEERERLRKEEWRHALPASRFLGVLTFFFLDFVSVPPKKELLSGLSRIESFGGKRKPIKKGTELIVSSSNFRSIKPHTAIHNHDHTGITKGRSAQVSSGSLDIQAFLAQGRHA